MPPLACVVRRAAANPPGRVRFLSTHRGFILLLVVAGPAMAFFAGGSSVVASVADDSVSYLLLARHFAGNAGELLAPWVARHAHFTPLFPLALAAVGGDTDLARAHWLVAACAVGALVAVYLYGTARLGSARRGALLALAVVLVPSTWVSAKGILSEPMFLALSFTALYWHESRIERGRHDPWHWAILGVLLAAAYLTRVAGALLAAALVAQIAWRFVRWRIRPPARVLLPLAMVGLAAIAWIVLRPRAATDIYAATTLSLVRGFTEQPLLLLSLGTRELFGGWVASFALAADAPLRFALVFGGLGALAVGGAVLRAARGGLDGWYVLATLAVLTVWVFDSDNMRRLLYPVVPLMLLHAWEAIIALCGALRVESRTRLVAGFAVALVSAMTLPGLAALAQRALDRSPLAVGYVAANMTDYYTSLDGRRAFGMAARHAAVLSGLALLASQTEAGARVMWMRPEYVALLGGREGVPLMYAWSEEELAIELRRSGARYVVFATLFKSDLRHMTGDPLALLPALSRYAAPAYAVQNPVIRANDFMVMRVDPAAIPPAP
jgi:hypothetical protein